MKDLSLPVRGGSRRDHFSLGAAADQDARRLQVPLKILTLDNPALQTLYPRRFTLIRPDQHIAWAGDVWPDSGAYDVLAMATGR